MTHLADVRQHLRSYDCSFESPNRRSADTFFWGGGAARAQYSSDCHFKSMWLAMYLNRHLYAQVWQSSGMPTLLASLRRLLEEHVACYVPK
jgi:hypothetical protein